MDKQYEIFRAGLLTTIRIRDITGGDQIQVKLSRHLRDDVTGKTLMNSDVDMYFTAKEFKEFFSPIIDDMKQRIDNADSIQ